MNSLIRKTLIFIALMTVVAAAGWFGRKAYKKSAEHRLVVQAQNFIQQKDVRNSALCLQRALQINPLSVEASALMADVLENAGVPAALSWRVRAAELQPQNFTNRLAWAQTAIRFNDFYSASNALAGVDEKARGLATYHKLAGALAWNLGEAAKAETQYAEALRLEPDNAANVLNLATIRLASTNHAVAAAGRVALEQIPTNSPLHLIALRHLVTEAARRKAPAQALAYSMSIVRDPSATFVDRLDNLQLLRDTESNSYGTQLATLKAAATNSAEAAFSLGRWMTVAEGPSAALQWLQALPQNLQTNQPMHLVITDCLVAVKDWKGLLAFVNKKDWGEADFYRLALEALGQRALGQNAAAETAWRKTIRLSQHRLDRLTHLVQLAAAWDWAPEKMELLRQITEEYPKEKWAVDQLAGQFYAEGKTRDLQDLMLKLQSAEPADPRLKNNLASIFLLRKSETETALRLAKEAYDAVPENPFFISTYAYALSLQGKKEEALKILGDLKPEQLQIPSVAAYYGVIQVSTGHNDRAREALARANSAKLLPEEREIVRLAMARL